MREVTRTIYKYSELSPESQERARDWYTSTYAGYEVDLDFYKEWLKEKGFNPDEIYYSCSYSQGDGACFTGYYDFDRIFEILADCATSFTDCVSILIAKQQHDYGYLEVSSIRNASMFFMSRSEEYFYGPEVLEGKVDRFIEILEEYLQDVCHTLYNMLQAEWDYLYSEECVSECLEDYEFYSNGEVY